MKLIIAATVAVLLAGFVIGAGLFVAANSGDRVACGRLPVGSADSIRDELEGGPFFQTGGASTMVRDVHIYDGEVRVAAHDSVNLSGSQPFTRFGVAHAPEVLWGVGISIGVSYGTGTAAQRTIDLISAGCDFQP